MVVIFTDILSHFSQTACVTCNKTNKTTQETTEYHDIILFCQG